MQGSKSGECRIDIDKLIEFGLTIEEYLLLYLIYTSQRITLLAYKSVRGRYDEGIFDKLIGKGYLQELSSTSLGTPSYEIESLKVTDKFTKDFFNLDKEDIKVWIVDWYNLWPKGVKTGGYPVRSGIEDCLSRMKKFMSKYPYTKDEIFRVTVRYIEDCRKKDYGYMKTAGYFIDKDKLSSLASLCENFTFDEPKDNWSTQAI